MPDNKQALTLTSEQLKELLATVVAEGKKPYVDEVEEARKEKNRLRLRQSQAEIDAKKKWLRENCTHLREDNTSAIAWMQNTDTKIRGFCMHCNTKFEPGDHDYERLLRIPTRSTGIIG